MSASVYVAQTNEISLPVASKRTVLQVSAPANVRIKVLGYAVFFKGTSATATPVNVFLERNDTSGTLDTVSGVVGALGDYNHTRQSVVGYNATVEPVPGARLDTILVHPQSGFEVRFPPGQEPVVDAGGRVAIACNAAATVPVVAKLLFEE